MGKEEGWGGRQDGERRGRRIGRGEEGEKVQKEEGWGGRRDGEEGRTREGGEEG